MENEQECDRGIQLQKLISLTEIFDIRLMGKNYNYFFEVCDSICYVKNMV